MPSKRNKILVHCLGTTMLVIFSISLVSLGLSFRDQDTYPSTFVVGEFRLDSVPRIEVPGILPEKIIARDGKELRLYLSDTQQTVALPLEDCGICFDFPATLNNLDAQLFTGGVSGLLNHSLIRGSLTPVELKPVLVVRDPERLNWQLALLKQSHDRQVIDAAAWLAEDRVEYSPHQDGSSVNLDDTRDRILESLQAGSLGPVQVQIEISPARISSEEAQKVSSLLGLSVGSLDVQSAEAMNHLNGLKNDLNGYILESGETLVLKSGDTPGGGSAKTVTAADGAAPIIAGACTDAGLAVQETAGGYVVSNNSDTAVMLWLHSSDYTLIAEVYGHQVDPDKSVRLVAASDSAVPGAIKYYKETTISGQEPSQTLLYDTAGQAGPDVNLEDSASQTFFADYNSFPADQFFKTK